MRYFDRTRMERPKILESKTVEGLNEQLVLYVENRDKRSQQKRPPVSKKVLSDPGLVRSLSRGFDGQCAYCERPEPEEAPRYVSHHRPPGLAADEKRRTSLMHYVWLTYEWSNLYWVCDFCRKAKSNLFPTGVEQGHLMAEIPTLRETEGELILDPTFHDPGEHLSFDPIGHVKGLTEEGDSTIRILNLNQPKLKMLRKQAYLDAVERIFGFNGNQRIIETGSPAPRSSEVFEALEFPGATTLALLRVADEWNIKADTLRHLQARLDRMGPEDNPTFYRIFFSRAHSNDPDDDPDEIFAENSDSSVTRRTTRTEALGPYLNLNNNISFIKIDNFKALKQLVIKLPEAVQDSRLSPSIIVLGENATGKSSVLEAITLALIGTEQSDKLRSLIKDEEVTPKKFIHRPDPNNWLVTAKTPLEIQVGFSGGLPGTTVGGNAESDEFEGTALPSKIVLAYGPRRFFSTKKKRRLKASAHLARSLFDPMATIANPIDWLQNCAKPKFDVAVRALKSILLLEEDEYFERDENEVWVRSHGRLTPMSELSVGYKSVIALTIDITRELLEHFDNIEFASAVVLIDEIETHLHPRWKMRIMEVLRDAFPNVQFVVTTHDPLCLRGMHDGEVFVLQRSEQDRSVEILTDLPSIRGMRSEQILTSEYFGLGSTDPDTDAKLARYHYLVSQVTNSDTDEIQLLRRELEETMTFGDTIQDQVYFEALKKADIEPFAPPTKIKRKSRKRMVSDILDAIKETNSQRRSSSEE